MRFLWAVGAALIIISSQTSASKCRPGKCARHIEKKKQPPPPAPPEDPHHNQGSKFTHDTVYKYSHDGVGTCDWGGDGDDRANVGEDAVSTVFVASPLGTPGAVTAYTLADVARAGGDVPCVSVPMDSAPCIVGDGRFDAAAAAAAAGGGVVLHVPFMTDSLDGLLEPVANLLAVAMTGAAAALRAL